MQKPYRIRNIATLLVTVFLVPFIGVQNGQAESTVFYNTSPFGADALIPQKKSLDKSASQQPAHVAQKEPVNKQEDKQVDSKTAISDENELEQLFAAQPSSEATSVRTAPNNSTHAHTSLPTKSALANDRPSSIPMTKRDTKLGENIEHLAQKVSQLFTTDFPDSQTTITHPEVKQEAASDATLATLAPAAGHAPQSPTPVLLAEQKAIKDSSIIATPSPQKAPLPAIANIIPLQIKSAPNDSDATLDEENQNLGELSLVSRSILESLPSELTGLKQSKEPWKTFDINREKQGFNLPSSKHEGNKGAAHATQRRSSGYDANYELERAYSALIAGETEQAVNIYKDVLSNDPENDTALFGLATTYHRLGHLEKAAALYGQILMKDPYNLETLNNFLALVGEESPEIAAEQMERLAAHNPEYSPIYAQLAALYTRLDKLTLAVDRMSTAVGIAPDNLTYKYNLAVLYDQAGDKNNAIRMYRQLLRSNHLGQALPTNAKAIQERLTFLSSNE